MMPRTIITLTYLIDVYLLGFALFILTRGSISLAAFDGLFVVHGGVAVVFLAVLAWYVRDVIRNRQLPRVGKALWLIAFFFAALLAFPVYFHRFHRLAPN